MPYDITEYKNFKTQMRDTILNCNGNFKNYETIVPQHFWGNKQSTSLAKKPKLTLCTSNLRVIKSYPILYLTL